MGFPAYGDHDALGLAELVKTGAVHPRELVDEALARIDRDNPTINAIVHRMDESARRQAEQPIDRDAPFAGVPFLAKDLLSSWQGEAQKSGSKFLRDYVAPHDSTLTSRYRKSGVITLGKTATPELGILPATEPLAFGPTRNPWDPTRTPGGSSGGSGAAVAARWVPMAGGGDGGGSIRIPSSCCGLFGLKPTRGRTPLGPDVADAWQGCALEHVLTRSVRDSAAMLDAIHGAEPGDPYAAPVPARPFLQEVGAPPGRLKIAFTTKALIPADVEPDCIAAVEHAAKLLRELGHDVVEAHPPIDGAQVGIDFVTMLVGEVAAEVAQQEALVGRKAKHGELEPETAMLHRMGQVVPAIDFALAVRRLRMLHRRVAGFFTEHDLLLTPTLAQAPIPVGAIRAKGAEKVVMSIAQRLPVAGLLRRAGGLEKIAANSWKFTPFTAPWNATGQPACNLPLHWNAGGLPIGVQLVGRFGDEATILRVASQVERAAPWRDRKPPPVAPRG